MNKKEIFQILMSKANVDFNDLHTDYVVDSEEKMLDLLKQEESRMCVSSIEQSSKLVVYEEKGVIFIGQCGTTETHPEGPNNEPPGMTLGGSFQWCTKETPLARSENFNHNGAHYLHHWRAIKEYAFASLEKQHVDYYK